LKGFEFPKALLLEAVPFSVENDLMTPKFSIKRPNLLKHYQKQVGVVPSQGRGDQGARDVVPSRG
jgi:long-subunit acyl-CoA synthetase (AMP-forming)